MKRLVLLAAVAAAARRRVAVCFWGINRSLDLTLPSIQKHLLAPLHARPRRRLAPRARLLRRARDERVSVDAVGAPQGRPGLAPRRRLDGVLDPLQRAVEALLAGETRRVDSDANRRVDLTIKI